MSRSSVAHEAPALSSTEQVARAIRSTGAGAVPVEEKLRLAALVLDAPEDSCFANRHRFVLDWLCGLLKAKSTSGAASPREDVRFWRLLDTLLHLSTGSSCAPEDDGAPPQQQLAPLLPGMRTRLSQSDRVLLQAAADAIASATAGDATAGAALCGRVRRVMRQMLHESWFRPGAEATIEYAASLCSSAARFVDIADERATEGGASPLAAACEHALLACIDAMRAVVALQGADVQPRKLLHLLAASLLRALLLLRAACTSRPRHTPPAGFAAARRDAARAIEQSMHQMIIHPDHVSEYAATLHRLGASGGGTLTETPPAAAADAPAAGAKGRKRSRGEAVADASSAGHNYTAAALETIAQLARDDDTGLQARGCAAATATTATDAPAGGTTRALLLPIQPLLLQWYRHAHAQQRDALEAERSTRQRLGLSSRHAQGEQDGTADAAASAGAAADFAFFRWLLVPRMAALGPLVDAASVALSTADTNGGARGEQAPGSLFAVSEAIGALSGLLRAAGTHSVYRPREDASGGQRSLITTVVAPTVNLANILSKPVKQPTPPAMHAGMSAAHANTCAALDALLTLDSLIMRPHLPDVIALLAAAPTALGGSAAASTSPAALLHTVIRTAAAERQLPLLLRTLAAAAVGQSASSGGVGLGALMGAAACWQQLADAVAAAAEAQAPELCDDLLVALETACASKGAGDGVAAWQLACLLGTVFDSLPLSAYASSALQKAAHRGLALADAMASSVKKALAVEKQPKNAAAMLLWRASAALERACADSLLPGGWGPSMPSTLPRALEVAHATLKRGGGDETEGGTPRVGTGALSACTPHLAAVEAVAYEVEWSHLELQVANASSPEDSTAGASTALATQMRKRLRQRLRLLTTWDAAEARRAARPSEWSSRIPACSSAHGGTGFVAHYALLCERAALVDEYAPSASLRRWLNVLWHAACSDAACSGANEARGDGRIGVAASAVADDVTRTSVPSAVWHMLHAAELYELPRVRSALLPSGWRWLQKRLADAKDVKGKKCRERLEFVLQELPPHLGGGDGGDEVDHAAGGEDGGDGAPSDKASCGDWAPLIGGSSEAHSLPLHASAWIQMANVLTLIGTLPVEWVPPEQVGWLLPRVLVFAQLMSPAGDGGADTGSQMQALDATLAAAAALATSAPAAARTCSRGKSFRRILRWCMLLPAQATADTPRAAEIETRCSELMRALTTAALHGVDARDEKPLLPPAWLKWADDVREALWTHGASSEHRAALVAMAAHLSALAAVVPPPPQRAKAKINAGADAAPAGEDEEAAAAAAAKAAAATAAATAATVAAATAWLWQLNAPIVGEGGKLDASAAICPAFNVLHDEFPSTSDGMPADDHALSAVLECVAVWLRCCNALHDHGATPPPPPRLSAAARCSIRILSQTEAGSNSSSHPRLCRAALALIDALSERPMMLSTHLPLGERRGLITLLLQLLRPLSRYAQLTPSGRPRPADGHTPLGMLRRLLAVADDGEGTFGWALSHLLDELKAPSPSAESTRAALLALALACAASTPAHATALMASLHDVLGGIVAAATRTADALEDVSDADSVRTVAVQALTALATNDQIKLSNSDGAALLVAAGSVAAHVELRNARASDAVAQDPRRLPSAGAFNASYFLLTALLRQRPRLVHASAPLLFSAVRGLLYALAHAAPGATLLVAGEQATKLPLDCARNMRRLLESIAGHKKVLVRHGSYILADVVAVCRERPLPAAGMAELLPGIHALLGMCTEIEVQAVHAASDGGRQRVLKELLESYERSFKHRGKV